MQGGRSLKNRRLLFVNNCFEDKPNAAIGVFFQALINIFVLLSIASSTAAQGPFAPPAGQSGTTAIHKDSPMFVGWATACELNRGYKDISKPESGYAETGECINVIGKAGERGVLSLGDGGSVILTFNPPIKDKPGYDFAVFENAFDDEFLELAFVEVSSDGENFVRFPSLSLTDTIDQIGTFGTLDATNIHNLAGKYKTFYGTPFDLNELKDKSILDISNVTHVKIIDVVGSLLDEYATYDSEGNKINDPWPTPFASGGFDLDAVGVINSNTQINKHLDLSVQPNPASANSKIRIFAPHICEVTISIFNLNGNLLWQSDHELHYAGVHFFDFEKQNLSQGIYVIKVEHPSGIKSYKMVYLDY